MSKQTFGIIPKIRQVDEVITPEYRSWIFEIHPEICFWALNENESMKHKKSTIAGRKERLELLRPHYRDLDWHLTELDRKKAAEHDLVDAVAAAWTAERIATGSASSISSVEESDSKGLRMEIVY